MYNLVGFIDVFKEYLIGYFFLSRDVSVVWVVKYFFVFKENVYFFFRNFVIFFGFFNFKFGV